MSGVSATLTPAISRVDGDPWLIVAPAVAVLRYVMAASSLTRLRGLPVLERRLAEPLFEPDVAEPRFAPGNQRALTESRAEVPRVRIGDNLAGIVASGEALTDQFVEPELLRTRHFNGAVHWRGHGDPADRLCDIIGRH